MAKKTAKKPAKPAAAKAKVSAESEGLRQLRRRVDELEQRVNGVEDYLEYQADKTLGVHFKADAIPGLPPSIIENTIHPQAHEVNAEGASALIDPTQTADADPVEQQPAAQEQPEPDAQGQSETD